MSVGLNHLDPEDKRRAYIADNKYPERKKSRDVNMTDPGGPKGSGNNDLTSGWTSDQLGR